MSDHAFIVATILANGGRMVASFELDARGQTVGARLTSNRFYRCSACGQDGHSIERCQGEGKPPRPTYQERRAQAKIERLNRAADRTLETAREEIARRIRERTP